jgi:hypothetical protein
MCALLLTAPQVASATTTFLPSKTITVEGTGHVEAPAHSIKLPGTTLPSQCGGVLYVDHDDKELFAELLAAQMAGVTVSLYYENAAPSVNVLIAVSQCKVVWVERS